MPSETTEWAMGSQTVLRRKVAHGKTARGHGHRGLRRHGPRLGLDSGATGLRRQVKGKLSRTRDGGQTWATIYPDRTLQKFLARGNNVVELHLLSDRLGWAVLREADVKKPLSQRATTLLKTVDGGRTWTCIQPNS